MTPDKPYRVIVVVDALFGKQLNAFPAEEPVWIVDSETNRPVAEGLWKGVNGGVHRDVTLFKSGGTPLEELLISELPTIDLHHGEFSHDPPWTVLSVIGVKWSERIAKELAEFGFRLSSETTCGFEATR